MFEIRLGKPGVTDFWNELSHKVSTNSANKKEITDHKKLGKCFYLLSNNPKHPGLNTHSIDALSKRYGSKVWQSYVENNKPAAGRIYWVYGPNRNDITIVGIEPHPNDKSNSYKTIKLSELN